jgi:hypothetical protein
MNPGPAREVMIELTEGEYVAARGRSTVTWLVRLNDAWVHISEWPAAEVERRETPSGTVWENLTRLRVPPGARLARIENRPAPYTHQDALAHLTRGARPQRKVTRLEFRVGNRGDLLRER